MIQNYAPVELVKANNKGFAEIKRTCCNARIHNADKLNVKDYIDALADDYHKNKIPEIENFLFSLFYKFALKNDPNFIKSVDECNSSVRTEFKDVFLFPILLEEWSKSKQVFKPEPNFADALLHTEKLCISKSMIEHLPYNLFYIDTSDCEMFKPIHGIFVYIKDFGDTVSFSLYSLTNNLVYFSFYITVGYDKQNCITLDFDKFGIATYNMYVPSIFKTNSIEKELDEISEQGNNKISRADVYAFAMQMIAYLSIEEPQLTESDYTKDTYKKPTSSSKVKNKWSEVRIQDVGIKYGNEFKKVYKHITNNCLDDNVKRKSPIPHFRCAHWHKFWVGEGRKQLVVKWIAPVFVGNGDNRNVVIHKVK